MDLGRLLAALADRALLDDQVVVVTLALDLDLAECLHVHLHRWHSRAAATIGV
jgi:hypothetical protein